jgi:GGDEF domain-containing protein
MTFVFTVFPGDDESEIELLKNADEAMYRIKKSGRNGVAVCGLQG